MHAYQAGRQVATAGWLIAFTCLLSACADPSSGGESGTGGAGEAQVVLGPPMSLIPGEAIGPVSVGMTHSELLDALGEPDSDFAFQRLITYRYNSVGLKVEMTSSDATKATDDSRVCAVGTLPTANLTGALLHGLEQDEVEAQLGIPLIDLVSKEDFRERGSK